MDEQKKLAYESLAAAGDVVTINHRGADDSLYRAVGELVMHDMTGILIKLRHGHDKGKLAYFSPECIVYVVKEGTA